jgi:NADH-quinone oxidoreductase subunit G
VATITINGQQVEVADDAMIMKAAEQLGVYIPHFCYHPGLSIAGNCRMCLVEVEGSPKLLASCCTPVRDGMVVLTESEKVVKARRGIMEFLLINHPLDCPICDQAGECVLQDYSYDYGDGHSRYSEERQRHDRENVGKTMVRDMNRCIACTRCVRFFHEVTGEDEYNVYLRGGHTEVGTYGDHEIGTKFIGNAAEICPVGALTLRDSRFKCRQWFFQQAESVCPYCANGCRIEIDYHKDVVHRFRSRPDHEKGRYWICDEGRFGYHRLNDTSARLSTPLVRKNGELAEATWDEAFAFIADTMKTLDDEGAALAVGSGHCTNEDNYALKRFAAEVLDGATVRFKSWPPPWVTPPARDPRDLFIEPDKSANAAGARRLGLEADPGLATSWDELATGRYQALFVMGADLLLGDPDNPRDPAVLDTLGLIVVQDVFRGPTTELAHVVLPALAFSERHGTYTNCHGEAQEFHAGPYPAGSVALADWEILARLGNRLGAEFPWTGFREVPWREDYDENA